MSNTVTVPVPAAPSSYEVQIGCGLINSLGSLTRAVAPHTKCALLADETVFSLYGQKIIKCLSESGYEVITGTFPGGETHKSIETVTAMWDLLLRERWERQMPVIALGGGIAGDVVGYVAASILRGVPVIQLPTTLLSMVDSSIGGKTGINHQQGKNLLGAFHYPTLTVIDPELLTTLSPREYVCGLAECIKHGLIGDAELFNWIEENSERLVNRELVALEQLVLRNVQFKRDIVAKDPLEQGVRALLNLGHTFGHAVEAVSGYNQFLHGEAVSLGLVAATKVSVLRQLCEAQLLERVKRLLSKVSLPIQATLPRIELLMEAMKRDKKVKSGTVRLVLPTGLGSCSIFGDTDPELVSQAWAEISRLDA